MDGSEDVGGLKFFRVRVDRVVHTGWVPYCSGVRSHFMPGRFELKAILVMGLPRFFITQCVFLTNIFFVIVWLLFIAGMREGCEEH